MSGWHMHDETPHSAWRDRADMDCDVVGGPTHPVIVLDPDDPTLRERLARAMFSLSKPAWDACTIRDLYLGRADRAIANLIDEEYE